MHNVGKMKTCAECDHGNWGYMTHGKCRKSTRRPMRTLAQKKVDYTLPRLPPPHPPSHPFLLSCSHAVVLRISTNALTRADKILFIFWGARAKLGENDEQWRKRQLAAYRLICINIVNIDVSVYGCTMGMTANPNPKRDIATFGTTQCVALFDSVYFMCILFARFRGAFHWKLTIEWDFALRMS